MIWWQSEYNVFHNHRGRSMEDHGGSNGSKTTPWRTPTFGGSQVCDLSFRLRRGRSAEDPCGSRGCESTPGHRPPQATVEDPRNTPRNSFGTTSSIPSRGTWRGLSSRAVGSRWPAHMWPHMWPPRVAGHRVATNPKNNFRLLRGRCAE